MTPNRVFFMANSPEYTNFLSPTGVPVSFYQGYFQTTVPALAEFASSLEGVEELEGDDIPETVPTIPTRSRSRTWAAAAHFGDPTKVSPVELLQRAVASSESTPQAAESNSVPTPAGVKVNLPSKS